MAGFREEIVHLVQKSVRTFSSIENADHQLNSLQTLNLMKRDLARNRIKETLHDIQVKVAAVAAQDLQAVATVGNEREAQLAAERGSLSTAKNMLLNLLQEAKSVVTARAGEVNCKQAEKLIKKLKMLIDTDYSPRHWEGFDFLEFTSHPLDPDLSLGFLRTSALDPRELSLEEVAGNKNGTLKVGQSAEFRLETGFSGELKERLVELLSAEVTGPTGETLTHTMEEEDGSTAVSLKFEVNEVGQYVVDVKLYETHINLCPLTLQAVKGELSGRRHAFDNINNKIEDSKNNITSLLNTNDFARGDETQLSPPLRSPTSDSPGQGCRTYGPRAQRLRSDGRHSPAKMPPSPENDILIGVSELSLEECAPQSRRKERAQKLSVMVQEKENHYPQNSGDFSSLLSVPPIVIQPKDLTPMKDKKVKIKAEPLSGSKPKEPKAQPVSPDKTKSTPESKHKKMTYEGLGVARHLFMTSQRSPLSSTVAAETATKSTPAKSKDVSSRKVSVSDADMNWRSKEKKPRDPKPNEVEKQMTLDEVKNIPLPKEPCPTEKKGTATPGFLPVTPPRRPFSCLTNLLNLCRGQDLAAKKILEIGTVEKSLSFPIGLATTKTTNKPNIVLCDTGHNMVKVFSWTGDLKMVLKTEEWGINLRRPSSVVVSSNGHIFIKDDNAIYKFSPAGHFIMKIGEKTLARPYGLAKTKDGHLVTLDHRKGIMVFDAETGTCIKNYFFPPINSPTGQAKFRFIAVHEDTVIAVNLGEHQVVFSSLKDGRIIRVMGGLGKGPGQFKEPSGVTVDEYGNLLVADSKNNRVQVFDMEGNFRCQVGFDDPIWRPSDIHLTEDGFLLVDNYLQHRVRIYRLG